MGPFSVYSPVTGWFSRVYKTEAEAAAVASGYNGAEPGARACVVVEQAGNAMQVVRGQPEYLGGPLLLLQLRPVTVVGGRGAVVRWSPAC